MREGSVFDERGRGGGRERENDVISTTKVRFDSYSVKNQSIFIILTINMDVEE